MKKKCIGFLVVLVMLLQASAGAADVQQAAAVEPAPVEETTELGLVLADIPEAMSAEQTVEAGHVERLREEEQEPNTAVFRNSDGTNTLYIFSEDIWYENEQGEKVDYSTELEAAGSDAAYRSASAAGELLLPVSVGEATPIRYSEGGASVTMYPTTDRIVLPEQDETAEARLQKPAARPAAGQVPVEAEQDGIAQAEQEEPAAAAESGADPAQAEQPSVTGEETETASMQPEAESAPESAVETVQPDMESAPETEAAETDAPEAPAYQPVSEKAVAGIASAAEAQAIAEANAQASLATGKMTNRAVLVSANDAAVPDKQSVEYFRASRDASIVTTPLLHGVKNEIVLTSYSGNNAYSFIADFGGLTPTESMGDSITLLDADGNEAAYMNVEEVRDAAGNLSLYNTIDVAPYGDGGQYIVTLTLDEAFLTEPGTVYPLAVSSTLQKTIGSADINDTDVNSGSPSTNYGSSSTMWVGYINGAKYRSYIQFIIGDYAPTIAPNGITNAYMILYEKSGNTSTFTLQPRIPSNIWSYTSLTWNNQPGYSSAFNGVNAPSNVTLTQTSTMYRVYMGAYVQACMRNYVSESLTRTIHEKRGLMLKISNESSAQVRMFNSTNASSNKPTLVVTYKENYYGGAFPYYFSTGYDRNCLGYALNIAKFLKPGSHAYLQSIQATDTATSYFYDCIQPYIASRGRSARIIGRTEAISSNEYRVAMRLLSETISIENGWPPDYHFWVENKIDGWKGLWSHKPGDASSSQITHTDNPNDTGAGWGLFISNGTTYYYPAPTIYFAVTK